jgi:hypothetical protein
VGVYLGVVPACPARFQFRAVTPGVTPIVNCVTYNADTNVLGVFFGYSSTYTTAVTIPAGNNNFFFTGDSNRNQPTVFEPGVHDRVFFTQFQPTPSMPDVTWFLGAGSATGKPDPRLLCNLPPYKGDWSSSNVPYTDGDLVRHNGFLWVLGLALADHGGEPGVSGEWQLWPGPIQGPQGPRDLKAIKDQKVIRDQRGIQGHRERPVLKDRRAFKERRDQRDHKDLRGHRGPPDLPALPAPQFWAARPRWF